MDLSLASQPHNAKKFERMKYTAWDDDKTFPRYHLYFRAIATSLNR